MRRFLVLSAMALLAAACGDDDAAVGAGGDPPTLAGRDFVVQEISGHEIVAGTEIRLSFSEDGRLGASAGCNSMGATYEVAGGRLEAGQMDTTEIGCDPARHDQDAWLAGFLTSAPTIVLAGDTLTLTDDSGDSIVALDRAVADPDRDLIGPTWEVDGLIAGDAVSSVPDGAVATVRFPDQSTIEFDTGCGVGGGSVEVSDGQVGGPVEGDGEIQFGDIAADGSACEDDDEQRVADHLLVVFGPGGAVYEIDADRLTITHDNGNGITFRALP